MTSIHRGRKRPAAARRRPPRDRSMRPSDGNDQGRTRSSDVSLHAPRRLAARALPTPPRLPAAAWTPRLVAALLARLATRLRRTRRRGHRLAQALLELAQASGRHVRRDPTQLWCRSVNRHGPGASSRTTWSARRLPTRSQAVPASPACMSLASRLAAGRGALPCLSLRRVERSRFRAARSRPGRRRSVRGCPLEAPEGRDVGEGVVFHPRSRRGGRSCAVRERERRISKPSAA
jgi:hypothetical protein